MYANMVNYIFNDSIICREHAWKHQATEREGWQDLIKENKDNEENTQSHSTAVIEWHPAAYYWGHQ